VGFLYKECTAQTWNPSSTMSTKGDTEYLDSLVTTLDWMLSSEARARHRLERKLLRKIDARMHILVIIYNLNYVSLLTLSWVQGLTIAIRLIKTTLLLHSCKGSSHISSFKVHSLRRFCRFSMSGTLQCKCLPICSWIGSGNHPITYRKPSSKAKKRRYAPATV
jgi:hypothetical protein